jgi:hypothetical protein
MSQDSRADFEISDEMDRRINGMIDGLTLELLVILSTLTAEERRELHKKGDKKQGWVDKCQEYAGQNPEAVPVFLDLAWFNRSVTNNARLSNYQRKLNPLMVALDDTVMLTGAEALSGATMFYQNIKLLAANGVVKAKAIYEDLSSRFTGGRRKKAEVVTDPN